MKNIAIQTGDELICFYTISIERAEEVLNKAGITADDIYEVKDDELQYYCFSSRLWDEDLSAAA